MNTPRENCGRSSPRHVIRIVLSLVLGVVLCAGVAGCASGNVDPARPRSHEAYLDLYGVPPGPLSWRVEKINPQSGKAHLLFEQYAPLDDRILRLQLKPGKYHLRISFLNLVIQAPAELDVPLESGRITPVKISLIEAGTVLVESKQTRAGGTYYGRFGRSTRLQANETTRFEVRAEAGPAEPYQPKSKTVYAADSADQR